MMPRLAHKSGLTQSLYLIIYLNKILLKAIYCGVDNRTGNVITIKSIKHNVYYEGQEERLFFLTEKSDKG